MTTGTISLSSWQVVFLTYFILTIVALGVAGIIKLIFISIGMRNGRKKATS